MKYAAIEFLVQTNLAKQSHVEAQSGTRQTDFAQPIGRSASQLKNVSGTN